MKLDYNSLNPIAEGKTKIIYHNPDDDKTVFMVFKDDITAGDGTKHDVIQGKAVVDWQTNRDIFNYLNRCGFRTHYVDTVEEKVALVKKLDYKIDLEVVTRRIAAGSILKWGTVSQGQRFEPVITQFHYKDDPLHDPMLDDGYIEYIIKTKNATEFQQMREMNAEIFLALEKAFAHFKIQLIDMKLEYGLIDDQVTLIDEISGGSFRLWPYAKDNVNLEQENVLSELDPSGRLDKDTYRMGEESDRVLEKFHQIARITEKFDELDV